MASQQSIDVYRFREIVRNLFDGLNLSDSEILDRIEENRKDLYDYCLLKNEIGLMIELTVDPESTTVNANAILAKLREMTKQQCDQSVQPLVVDTETKNQEIERLNRCISGIASFLDLPSDAKQPDICFAIMELKKAYKKLNREPLSNEQIVIANLRHDLLVAQKVIARLVGE